MATAKKDKVRIVHTPISEVQFWPRNPKEHDLEAIKLSIRRFGFIAPIVKDETSGYLVAGHGRSSAAAALKDEGPRPEVDLQWPPANVVVRKDGTWCVPVMRGVHFSSVEEAEAYLLADNRLTEIGGWNDAMLADILRDLKSKDLATGIGWSDRELKSLLDAVDPTRTRGKRPEEKVGGFLDAEIKQIVLFFDSEQYDQVIGELRAIMDAEKLESHTDVFLHLLKQHNEAA